MLNYLNSYYVKIYFVFFVSLTNKSTIMYRKKTKTPFGYAPVSLNRNWMLKYSEHREQLKACLSSNNPDSSIVYEVSYPFSFKGVQTHYVGASICFDSFPAGVVIKRLTSDEVKRLYYYYQCDKSLSYK